MKQIDCIHYRITFFYRGKPTISQEVWQRGNRGRHDGDVNGQRFTEINADGKFWFYDPTRRTATFQRVTTGSPFAGNTQSLRVIQSQMQQALDGGRGEDLGTVTYKGRRCRRAAVVSPVTPTLFSAAVPGRLIFTIDQDRLLPVLTEQQVQERGKWTTVSQLALDLESRAPTSVFTITDKHVRVYDINAYGAQAGSRFAKPLASKRFATRTIAIRDVQSNKDGDLFILYTDGSTLRQARQTSYDNIHDDRKTKYAGTAGALNPFMYHQNPQLSRGMVVDGEVLQGFCLVRQVPKYPLPTSALPRTVTITLHFDEQKGKKIYHPRVTFTVPVRHNTSLLPTYANDLAILNLAGGTPEQFKKDREWARRSAYWNSRDWRGMIQSTDRAIAQEVVDVHTYLDRAEAFGKLSRPVEARQALSEAHALDINGMYAPQIKRSEEELQKSSDTQKHL